jgi:hypothetical protein
MHGSRGSHACWLVVMISQSIGHCSFLREGMELWSLGSYINNVLFSIMMCIFLKSDYK